MSVNPKYSAAFKEQALSKVLSRGERTIGSVAEELNLVRQQKLWVSGGSGNFPST